MLTTLVIGKTSNLSMAIVKMMDQCVLISSRDILNDKSILNDYKNQKINIIFNNFQPANKLNILDKSTEYITHSILTTSYVLDYFIDEDINKIIYTSSSSVYGNNVFCNETDELKPISLHASLKVANEKLIEKYCTENRINYTIARVFNMYGGNDKFSVISKILAAAKEGDILTIINRGNSIRDFIHIDDVVAIYMELMELKVQYINIGTGEGVSIKTLLDFLHLKGVKLKVESISRDELKVSTANIKLLTELVKMKSFKSIEEYFNKELCL